MALRNIDFSNGIRSEDIQYNFDQVEGEIARERLAISGHGISSGLEFTINGFQLKISQGSLIDIDGKEIFLPETTLNIPYPRLIQAKEALYTVQSDGQIALPDVPYSLTRQRASQYDLPANYGISIIDYSNASKTLPVMVINGKIITTDTRWIGQLVRVSYSYSSKRYDTVYIDKNNQIKVMEGITSNSPSVSMPEASQYKYILGIVEVEPYYTQQDGKVVAKLSVERDMKSLRNIYTDGQNNLYLAGVSFDDLQIIHMVEPESPYENQLWYDAVSNKLRVWKTVDGIAQWVNVNDTSIIPIREFKIWTPENNPVFGDPDNSNDPDNIFIPFNEQVFIFHAQNDLNMRFVPDRNELEIVIDNGALHTDQFEEITVEDAVSDALLKQLLITHYGYTDEWLSEANVNFENVGLGFKLAQPLDKACFVEARATQRVNDNPIRTRFQRTATFVATDSFYYKAENGKVVTTNVPYRVLENQLEVFVDGKRLDLAIGYIEGVDLEVASRIQGAASYQFQINADIPENARVSYKITASVYSYDNVEKVVGDLADRVTAAENTITAKSTQVDEHMATTNTNLANMQTTLNTIQANEAEHDTFLKNTDKLDAANMSDAYNAWHPKGLINQSVIKTAAVVSVAGISPEDFIEMFDIQATGGNSILRRGTDYDITRDATSGNVYINFINPDAVPDGHTLYITGIKFKA